MKKFFLVLMLIVGTAHAQYPQDKADIFEQFLALVQKAEGDVDQPLNPQIFFLAEQLNSTESFLVVANQLYLRGEYRLCMVCCNKCLDLKPLCFSAILLEGLALHRLGQRQQALARLLLVLDPEQCDPTKDVELDRNTEAVLVAIGSRLSEEHYKSAMHRLINAN